MLTLALAATLIGFVLLILGLVTGTVWLAVGCIVVCLIGLAFLLVDVLSGRQRESGRSLEDLVPGARAAGDRDPDVRDTDGRDTDGRDTDGRDTDEDDPRAGRPSDRASASDTDAVDDSSETVTQSFGSPTADAVTERRRGSYEPPAFEPGMADPRDAGAADPRNRPPNTPGPWTAGPAARPAPERREGTLEDYVRSVGGDVTQPDARPSVDPHGRGGPAPSGGWDVRPPNPGPQNPEGQPGWDIRGGGGPGEQAGPDPRPQNQGWQAGSPPPRHPAGESSEPDPRPRARTEKFDPLDPNWRPPLD